MVRQAFLLLLDPIGKKGRDQPALLFPSPRISNRVSPNSPLGFEIGSGFGIEVFLPAYQSFHIAVFDQRQTWRTAKPISVVSIGFLVVPNNGKWSAAKWRKGMRLPAAEIADIAVGIDPWHFFDEYHSPFRLCSTAW